MKQAVFPCNLRKCDFEMGIYSIIGVDLDLTDEIDRQVWYAGFRELFYYLLV